VREFPLYNQKKKKKNSGKFTGKYKKGEDPKDAQRKGVVMSDKDFEISEEVCKIAEEVGHTESQVTLNWALQQPNTIPLVGVRTVEQLLDNLGALEFALSEEHIERLNLVSSFDLGFPHNIIGTSYQSCPWLKDSGTII
jgi:aryl-alcohol dehydrogenase-like predicted oxidoreductase